MSCYGGVLRTQQLVEIRGRREGRFFPRRLVGCAPPAHKAACERGGGTSESASSRSVLPQTLP